VTKISHERVPYISALEVFFKNDMRYINSRFTYLLTYLDNARVSTRSQQWVQQCAVHLTAHKHVLTDNFIAWSESGNGVKLQWLTWLLYNSSSSLCVVDPIRGRVSGWPPLIFWAHSCRPSNLLMVHAVCGTWTVSVSASLRDSSSTLAVWHDTRISRPPKM